MSTSGGESELEIIQIQLSRLLTRRDVAEAALGIIFATAALVPSLVLSLAPAGWRHRQLRLTCG
jgi:hypothetical protein